MKKLLLLTPLILVGCAVVPATRIAFDPSTHQVAIRSPKDISISNLVIEVEGQKATIKIGSYTSKSNVEALKSVAEANANNMQIVTEGAKLAIDLAKQAAK